MKDQTYNKKSLEKFLYRTRIKGLTSAQRKVLKNRLASVSKLIRQDNFKFRNFKNVASKDKWIWYNRSNVENLILNSLNSQIKTMLDVKQSNRNLIIKQVKTLIEAGNEFYIIKADVENFYESILWSEIIEKLNREHHLSIFVNHLLRNINGITSKRTVGLPRGVSLSATLSEYCMQPFDDEIKRLKNVFYYKRFVDDFIVICSDLNDLTEDFINGKLPFGLQLNNAKFKVFRIVCRCRNSCVCGHANCQCKDKCNCREDQSKFISLDFLGYNFRFSDIPEKNRKGKTVKISLAKKKVNKLKSRIIHSLLSYYKTKDKDLLEDRISFLTSNFYVFSNIENSNLKAGIYYSYPELNNLDQLKTLDLFLRKAVCSKKGSFGAKMVSVLTPELKKNLSKYSFYSGYTERRLIDFTSEEIAEIKKCFRDG